MFFPEACHKSSSLRLSVRLWSSFGCPFFTSSRQQYRSVRTSPVRKHSSAASLPDEAMTKLTSPLETKLSFLLEKRRKDSKLRSLKSSPPDSVDFSSNDFLSLSTNPTFHQHYLNALNKSTYSIGSTGSRLLDGNSTFAEALESSVASFHGAEAGLLTNSGFDANVSIFTCLPQPGDVIVYDELIHASVHDGMRQSRAAHRLAFKHNDVQDLQRVLQGLKESESHANIFIAVESVYSMEGDLAPLREIADLADNMVSDKRAHLIVDEAHATGVYGPKGAGLVSLLGLEHRVSVRLHTFGKALACNGAIILCSPTLRLYLINYARPLIYTTFMSYPSLMAIRIAYDWLESGRANAFSLNLNKLITHLHQRLQSLLPLTNTLSDPALLTFPDECPKSPIFALLSRTPRELASHCQAAGFVVRAVVPPTVPAGTERVRVCLHAGNTEEEIDRFVDCVGEWAKKQERRSATISERVIAAPVMETQSPPAQSSSLRPAAGALMSKL